MESNSLYSGPSNLAAIILVNKFKRRIIESDKKLKIYLKFFIYFFC